jgi:molybdate transport system substrate-binding protein
MSGVDRSRRTVLRAVLVGAPLAVWPAAGASATPRLTIFAASDLAFAFKEIVPLFERATGATVTLVVGSTGTFAHQIEAGAPADVFFSANADYVDGLIGKGRVIAATRTLYGQGRIVLAAPRNSTVPPTALAQLAAAAVRRVAIANPQHAPYGKAAEQALRSSQVWDAVKPKLVYGENIRHALQFVQTAAVDAGIVALSVANVPEVVSVPIDPKLHAPLDQVAAVVRRSAVPELGLSFIQFVNGAEGRPIMKRFGFRLPGEF